MKRHHLLPVACLFAFVVFSTHSLRGDTVELDNGDVLNGKVLSLDAKQLKLQSDALGEITVRREKVASIHLGDQPRQRRKQPGTPRPAAAPPASAAPKLPAVPTVEDVLKELQTSGIDTRTMGAIQDKFPLLATPEVKEYFSDKVGGLMTGRLGVQDIRKDAIKVRDEIVDLKKDLGPQADALNGYLSILETFIRHTDPGDATSKKKPSSKAKGNQ
jgi:hypothetical protein